MSYPNEARVVVDGYDLDKVTDAAECLLDWITSESESISVEVYDDEGKFMAMVECAKNATGHWKAVDVR